MSFRREPLLTSEDEKELIEKFHVLWSNEYSYREIAQSLELGEEGTKYAQIKPEYLRYYRQKFQQLHEDNPIDFPLGFAPRKKPSFPKGSQRYTVSPEQLLRNYGLISPAEFVEVLNEKLPWDSEYCRKVRSFLLILYFSPLRQSEIRDLTAKNIEITKTKVILHLLRKKKKIHKAKDEPISIPRTFPLAEEIVNYIEDETWAVPVPRKQLSAMELNEIKREMKQGKRKKGDFHFINNRPWRITGQTARRYVKDVFGESFYCHFFRFRFLTEGASDPETSLDELIVKSKLTLGALQKYIKPDERLEDRFDKRKLKKMKREGVI